MTEGVAVKSMPMRLLYFFFCFCIATTAVAQKSIHSLWTTALKEHVDDDGRVNYAQRKKDTTLLDDYIASLEENPPAEYWSKNDSLAYFINAYNAVTVKLILDHYPLKSIRNLVTPWRFKRFTLAGKKISLNHIEHQILRKMGEARIHFAINCASASCPKLLNTAFYAHSMEEQLEAATRDFINDPIRNQIKQKEMEVSRIFQWFAGDFGSKKERHAFLRKYASIAVNENAKVRFLNYDWQLNE